jgi:hypothetical protein
VSAVLTRQPGGIPAGGQFAPPRHSDNVPGLVGQKTLAQVLHLTSLPVGQSRTITPETHRFEDIDTVTVKNIGLPPGSASVIFVEPVAGAAVPPSPGTRAELKVTLPEASGIAGLYDEDWSARGAQAAALRAVEKHLGLTGTGNPRLSLPADTAGLDPAGNLTFTFYEAFSTTDGAIDPGDLESWMEPYQEFSDPAARERLREAIAEEYARR